MGSDLTKIYGMEQKHFYEGDTEQEMSISINKKSQPNFASQINSLALHLKEVVKEKEE